MHNALAEPHEIAALLTQVRVFPEDCAFQTPTKPIGPIYNEAEERALLRTRGWHIAQEGTAWRRVVASPPPPHDILELAVITMLVERGVICIGLGGGGIRVIRHDDGTLRGVDAAYTDWGTDQARTIAKTTPKALVGLDVAVGSMGPKIEAACRFIMQSGGMAGIGRM